MHCLFDRLLVVLVCPFESFWEPKIDQNATCDFLITVKNLLVFPVLLRLGVFLCWSYTVSFVISFWASIFDPFEGRCGTHFGKLWGFQIGHFEHRFLHDFCLSAQERPKGSQESPKGGPRAPKSGPRAPQEEPRAAQDVQVRPMGGQERQKSGQERLKSVTAPRSGTTAAKSAPRRAKSR